jgi:predicted dienelactone hydrolase
MGLTGSLLLLSVGSWPARATERLEVEIDGIVLPVSVEDLRSFGRLGDRSRSELATWLRLLDPDSREGLVRLLNAPVLTRRSLGQQLLSSWGAAALIDALGALVRVEGDGSISSSEVLPTLERLLDQQEQVSTLDVLHALPTDQLRLDLNALLKAAHHWQQQLERHTSLMAVLAAEPSTRQGQSPAFRLNCRSELSRANGPATIEFSVRHRAAPIQVQVWSSLVSSTSSEAPADRPWLLIMPGLGGDPEHFHWLAEALSAAGWPVVIVEHPGSDAEAVQALLDGRQSFDGASALRQRLLDLDAVLASQRKGRLPVKGTNVVLVGHSLGALTALLAAGADPASGIDRRCRASLAAIPLTNLSELLQCELADSRALKTAPLDPPPLAVVGLNSFGGLIWPRGNPTRPLVMPLLLFGGTLDLITPPLDEQIPLLRRLGQHPLSRVVVVEGASHFSPIRVESQAGSVQGDDLFQLGEELVGVNPLTVQTLIAQEMIQFLEQLESTSPPAAAGHFDGGTTRWHRLNRNEADRLIGDL